jgi:hypothetical protein
MRKFITFVILQILFSGALFARKVAGNIYEAGKRTPVDVALVRCFDASRQLLAYAYSDEKGHFELEVAAAGTSMQVSCMGFQTVTIAAEHWTDHMQVELQTSEIQIKEVVVTSKRLEEKADTLVYSVAGFAQPQDRSIADVMTKMPGLEIKPNGQIEYNGMAINKFYIEGLDLMGNKYALASNNLNRRHVKSVEILKNHQPIAALRGKSFSEQAAINLVLEDNAKWHLTGTADLGGGGDNDATHWLHDNRLLAMLFKSRTQNLSIYKGNNIGADISSEVLGVSLQDRIAPTEKERSWLTPMESYASDLSEERTTFNESHLIATNHLNRIGESATFRTQLSYFYHDYHHELQRLTDYLLSDDASAVFNDSYRSSQIQHHADANLSYELNNSNLYLKNQTVASLQWINGRNNLVSNQTARQVTDCTDQRYVANHLQMTMPMTHGRTLAILSSVAYNQMPQSLTTLNNLMQQVDYRSLNTYHYVSMMTRLFGLYFKNQLALETRSQKADFQGAENDASSASRLTKRVPSWTATLHVRKDNVYWEGSALLKYWDISSSIGDKSAFLPEWNTTFRLEATPKSTYSLRYGHTQSFFDLQRLTDTPYYIGYRTLSQNRLTLDNAPADAVTLRYEFTDPVKGLFLSALVQGNVMARKSVLKSGVVDDQIYLKSYVDANFHRRSLNASATLSKAFGWWKSMLALSGNYIYTEDKRLRLDALVPTYQNTLLTTLTYTLKPTKQLSAELKGRLSLNKVNSQSVSNLTRQWNVDADLFYKFTERLSVSWQNSYCHYVDMRQHVLFSDVSARYDFGRFEVSFVARNLGNKQTYQQELITTDYQVFNRYQLRPREYEVKFSISY